MKHSNISKLRIKTLKALAYKITTWDNEVVKNDYSLDNFYREIAGLPPLPQGNTPLVGFFPAEKEYQKLFRGLQVPEVQLRAGNYLIVDCPVLGKLTITGGFMEPHGHSRKSQQKAIFNNGTLKTLPPSNRNLGIDYVTPNINAWYDGTCLKVRNERGYGLRAYFQWDVNYTYNGKEYPVFGAFAHAQSFSVKPNQKVNQGDFLGKQGSSGGNYPVHIDYRQWIVVDSLIVDLSPNALERQIHNG